MTELIEIMDFILDNLLQIFLVIILISIFFRDLIDTILEWLWLIIIVILAFLAFYYLGLFGLGLVLFGLAIIVGIIFFLDSRDFISIKGNGNRNDNVSGDYEWNSDEETDEQESENQNKRWKPVNEEHMVSMEDIIGLEDAKESINQRVILPIKYKHLYKKYDKSYGGGIMLYGLPGTGKTMFAQAVASELDAAFFEVKSSDIMSKWYGDSESRIKLLFQEARRHPKSIIFFDEFDALGKKRDSESLNANVVPELLSQIQGFQKTENLLLLLAATNRPWDVDPALMRPGRFNEKIYIPLPDHEARFGIIKKKLIQVPVDSEVSFEYIARKTEGFNAADVVELCDQLKTGPILRTIKNNSDNEKVTCADVYEAMKKATSSVSKSDVEEMDLFIESIKLL